MVNLSKLKTLQQKEKTARKKYDKAWTDYQKAELVLDITLNNYDDASIKREEYEEELNAKNI